MNKEEETSDDAPILCDGCGIDMRDEKTGESTAALSFHVLDSKGGNRLVSIFGKRDFNFCFECWLRSLGAKEK